MEASRLPRRRKSARRISKRKIIADKIELNNSAQDERPESKDAANNENQASYSAANGSLTSQPVDTMAATQTLEKTDDLTAGQSAETTTIQAPEQTSDDAPDQAPDQAFEQASEQGFEQTAGETTDQVSEQAAGEAASQDIGSEDLTSADGQGEKTDGETDPLVLPTKNNPLYNTSEALRKLEKHPELKLRREGKYYLKILDVVNERHQKVKRNKRGDVIPVIKKEVFGPIEHIVSRFCEDVMCISRASFLPLTTQGERHLIWVGKKKATHIINRLNGNGCYVINRFPGDIFLKDKQVMGVTLQKHMLAKSNVCPDACGIRVDKEAAVEVDDKEKEAETPSIGKICSHMVANMQVDSEGCSEKECPNNEKKVCEHLDIFIPEVQSFCTYNALQEFSNRLSGDLKNQKFVCKPAYLYKGYGFRFFKTASEFQEFYHMTEGKETSRHDFMVQRLVDNPYLFNDRKFDIRAFLLVIVLRHRRVISFVHTGFCRLAADTLTADEDKETDEDNSEEPEEATDEKAVQQMHDTNMRTLICTYQTPQEKAKRQRLIAQRRLISTDADRSVSLEAIFEDEDELKVVKQQIFNIGRRITQAIENKVWECFGCFQLFSMDLCVDMNKKVWLIEVNSHAISEVDTLSPTQRKFVPAVVMEAIGLVMETTYKSYHNMRLRKSPSDEFETTGFLFRQNFNFVFSTLAKKRMDYVWPKPAPKKDLPYYERIAVVDRQMKSVERRKAQCEETKRKVIQEAIELKKRRKAKKEEES